MKIAGCEYVEVSIDNIQKENIVVWTDKRGQHTNRVAEICNNGVKVEMHVTNELIFVPFDKIKKCWKPEG